MPIRVRSSTSIVCPIFGLASRNTVSAHGFSLSFTIKSTCDCICCPYASYVQVFCSGQGPDNSGHLQPLFLYICGRKQYMVLTSYLGLSSPLSFRRLSRCISIPHPEPWRSSNPESSSGWSRRSQSFCKHSGPSAMGMLCKSQRLLLSEHLFKTFWI